MGGGLGPHRASWDPKDSGRQPGPTCLHRSCPGVEVEHGPQLMGSLVALCLPNLAAGQAGSLNGVWERVAWVACGPLGGTLGRGHGQVPAFAIGDIRHLGFGLLVSCLLPALTVQVRGHPQSLLVSEYFVAEETVVWGQVLPYRVPSPSLSRGGTWESVCGGDVQTLPRTFQRTRTVSTPPPVAPCPAVSWQPNFRAHLTPPEKGSHSHHPSDPR